MFSARTRVAGNAVLLTSAHVLGVGLSAVYSIALVRHLGPSAMGQLAIYMTMTDLAFSGLDIGITPVTLRLEAQQPEQARAIFRTALKTKAVLLSVATAIGFACAASFDVAGWDVPAVLAATAAAAASGVAGLYVAHFKATEHTAPVMMSAVCGGVTTALTGLALIWTKAGIAPLIFAFALGSLVKSLTLEWHLEPGTAGPHTPATPRLSWSELIRAALPLGLSSLMHLLSVRLDTLLLGYWSTMEQVGYYNACQRILNFSQLLLDGFHGAVWPVLAHRFIHDLPGVSRVCERIVSLSSLVSVPVALGSVYLAGPAVVLLYGSSYAPAGVVLMILGLLFAMSLEGQVYGTLMASGDDAMSWASTAASGCGLLTMLVSTVLLVPRFGAVGSAATLFATNAAILLVYALYIQRRLFPIRILAPNRKGALCGLAALAAGLALAPAHPRLAVAAAATVYAVCVLWLAGVYADLSEVLAPFVERARGSPPKA